VRSSILLASVLAACTTSGPKLGDKCSSKTPCGGGQTCDMTNPGGPICIDANGDLDGDGIPNGKDFCNHMPGGAFDEDGDGIGDECDACPIAKPPATPDGDGDMVDAPCDPDTTTGGDKITVFNGFNAALPTTWTATAAWSVSGGEAVMTPSNPATLETLTIPLPTPSSRVAILAAYRVDATPSAASVDAGVRSASRLPMGVTAVTCGANRNVGDTLQIESNAGQQTSPGKNLFNPANHYRLGQQLVSGPIKCGVISEDETVGVTSSSNGEQMTEVGLYARGTTVRFAYVLVIQR
jgi:hypothetical protein